MRGTERQAGAGLGCVPRLPEVGAVGNARGSAAERPGSLSKPGRPRLQLDEGLHGAARLRLRPRRPHDRQSARDPLLPEAELTAVASEPSAGVRLDGSLSPEMF